MLLRSLLKTGARQISKRGALSFVWKQKRKDRPIWVLMYHGISDRQLPPELFKEHVDYFSRHFDSYWASEIPQLLSGDIVPKRPPIVLTFDDGMRSNASIAAPLLEQAGLKGTFYLISDLLGGAQMMWNHDVLCRLEQCNVVLSDVPTFPDDDIDRFRSVKAFVEQMKSWSDEKRTRLIQQIQAATPDFKATQSMLHEYGLMSETDVQALPNNIEVGSHTATHRMLPALDESQQLFELQASKQKLEKICGRPIKSFCYPNGNYDEKLLIVAQNLYSTAVAARTESVARVDSNLWAIPRVRAYGRIEDLLLRMIRLAV